MRRLPTASFCSTCPWPKHRPSCTIRRLYRNTPPAWHNSTTTAKKSRWANQTRTATRLFPAATVPSASSSGSTHSILDHDPFWSLCSSRRTALATRSHRDDTLSGIFFYSSFPQQSGSLFIFILSSAHYYRTFLFCIFCPEAPRATPQFFSSFISNKT